MPTSSIAEMMQREIAAWEILGAPVGQNLKAAVLEHGQAYELDREATAARRQGLLKNCFGNATDAVIDARETGEDLTYVEGFAHSGLGLVAHHAWVVNAEGKALELTWRDGGTKCGHCHGGEVDLEYDEDDPETWEPVECRWCDGTGELPDGETYRTLEHAEYYGIAVDVDTLVEILLERGMYGALNTQEDLDRIIAARD